MAADCANRRGWPTLDIMRRPLRLACLAAAAVAVTVGTVAVADTRRRGMRDLVVGTDRYVWNGTRYVDARPAPAVDLRPARRQTP